MILVWGSSSDPPVAAILGELDTRGAETLHVDNAALELLEFDISLAEEPKGWISLSGRRVGLDRISAIYLRPEPVRDTRLHLASGALLAVASLLEAVVVNRPAAGRSNLSKPYQLMKIEEAGLKVSPTLVTTDPAAAREFLAEHKRLVYKSISGIRSIVATLDESDAARLERVSTGPVQFQKWIEGIDVRVHVVGEACFATAIESDAADYRYGEGRRIGIVETRIDDELAERLIGLASSMGLLVAGIDLRLTPDDEWVCFEVNPSPGFTFYEEATGQQIAAAVAHLLLSESHGDSPAEG